MNKAQKKTIVIALLEMAVMILFPPVETQGYYGRTYCSGWSCLIYEIGWGGDKIYMKHLMAELAVVVFIGGALVILFGLKKID